MLTGKWQKSTRSGGGANSDCLEARLHNDMIEVRDSKNPNGGTLQIANSMWSAFLAGAKNGEFDI